MDNKKQQLIELMNSLTKQDLISMLQENQLEIIQLKEERKESKEKVEFYNAVAADDSLIEMSAVAKILNFKNMGRNKLFNFAREKGILRSSNEPYQEFVDRGYFKVIEQIIEMREGETMINRKTMVTNKGIDYIRKILVEEGYNYNFYK